MNASMEGEQRRIVSWFFKYVTWPALQHLLYDLFPPGVLIDIQQVLETTFLRSAHVAMTRPDETESTLQEVIERDERLSDAPEWIKKMLVNVINEFTLTIARYYKSTTPDNDDLIEYVENAMILHLFDAIFWKFPHDMLIMHSRLPVNSIAEIKEKLLEQLRHYLDGDISLKEAKRAAAQSLERFDLDSDLVHEIIASYIANFYEIIKNLDPKRLHDFIETFHETRGGFLESTASPDDHAPCKIAVLRWFEQDIVNVSMKSVAELYPELSTEEISEWKVAITMDLDHVLQNLLSFDDFEKRLLSRLKLPRLEFDIEKGASQSEPEDHFMHIEDRGGALETIIASAELIYQESLKDPTLKDLATRIESRKQSLDNLYM